MVRDDAQRQRGSLKLLLVNEMEVEWAHSVPSGLRDSHVAWAAIYANFIAGVYIYDFMDYRMNGAPLIYLGLLSLQVCFFLVVLALDRVSEWSALVGALLVLAMTWRISTVRNPDQG